MPRQKPPAMSAGLKKIKKTPHLQAKLARALGISRQAVGGWKVIPLNRVLEVEAATSIHRNQLRPDLFALLKPKKTNARK